MPKKKLTKSQVKRKLKTLNNTLYDLVLDRMGYGTDSFSPLAYSKLFDMQRLVQSAIKRMK